MKKTLLALLLSPMILFGSSSSRDILKVNPNVSLRHEGNHAYRAFLETEYNLEVDRNFSSEELSLIEEAFSHFTSKINYVPSRVRKIKLTRMDFPIDNNSEDGHSWVQVAQSVGCGYRFNLTDENDLFSECSEIEIFSSSMWHELEGGRVKFKEVVEHELMHIFTRDARVANWVHQLSLDFKNVRENYDSHEGERIFYLPEEYDFSEENPDALYPSEYADNISFFKRFIDGAYKKIGHSDLINDLQIRLFIEEDLCLEDIAETGVALINGKNFTSPIIQEKYRILARFFREAYGVENVNLQTQ